MQQTGKYNSKNINNYFLRYRSLFLAFFILASLYFVNGLSVRFKSSKYQHGSDPKCFSNDFPRNFAAYELNMFKEKIKGCIWTGHLHPDTDSIGAAIGAASLFDGIPARSGTAEINSETKWALDYFSLQNPTMLDTSQGEKFCVVDTNQITQLPRDLKASDIMGIVDHHALVSTLEIPNPVKVDIAPIGSASTIVARYHATMGITPSKEVAGILLAAMISDTLNFKGPTTTEMDEMMRDCLRGPAGVNNVNEFALGMFKTKAEGWAKKSAEEIIRTDVKEYYMCEKKVVWATIETTDTLAIMDRKEEIVISMSKMKEEVEAYGIFVAVVDILNLQSQVFILSETEKNLAVKSYNGKLTNNNSVMDLGKRVSRKEEFIPPMQKTICAS